MKLGYLGPPGSYSYEAACLYGQSAVEKMEYVALPNFTAIIDGVEQGSLDGGIIPVENSTHGAVATAMDMLIHLDKGTVCGEITLNIEHCLLCASELQDLQYVYSHEQALEQCRHFFSKQYPQIELVPCASTSQACEKVIKEGFNSGAIASKMASRLYNLPIIAQNIQDNVFNQTRFLIIANKQTVPTGRDKTSMVISFADDCPGSLYNILKSFACRNINLTRIESRPAKHLMGKYIFHIDFLGHVQDEQGGEVLQEVREQVSWLKILGSYPLDSQTPLRTKKQGN